MILGILIGSLGMVLLSCGIYMVDRLGRKRIKKGFNDGYNKGYNEGYEAGYRLGKIDSFLEGEA